MGRICVGACVYLVMYVCIYRCVCVCMIACVCVYIGVYPWNNLFYAAQVLSVQDKGVEVEGGCEPRLVTGGQCFSFIFYYYFLFLSCYFRYFFSLLYLVMSYVLLCPALCLLLPFYNFPMFLFYYFDYKYIWINVAIGVEQHLLLFLFIYFIMMKFLRFHDY